MMRLGPLALDVADGFRSRPGRTFLAFIGVALGLFALTLTLGVLRGFQVRARALAAELGAHSAALTSAPSDEAGRAGPALTRRHLDLLRAGVPEAVWTAVQTRAAIGPDGRQQLWLVRSDDRLAAVRGWRLRSGRFLDAVDVRDGASHAVVSEAAAERFGWALADTVSLDGRVFRIVGILSGGDGAGDSASPVVSAAEPMLIASWTALGEGGVASPVDALHVSASDERSLRSAIDRATRILAAPDLAPRDTAWITRDTLLQELRRWRTGVAWGSGLLAALCLLLGGNSLMSLLLSDVRNRVPEIGLRLSLGATPADIAALFMVESMLLTFAAGLAGMAAAWPALRFLAAQTRVPVEPAASSALAVLGVALALGFLFSRIPARLAARTSASEALRND
jgi:putative ABC transport system permease protein